MAAPNLLSRIASLSPRTSYAAGEESGLSVRAFMDVQALAKLPPVARNAALARDFAAGTGDDNARRAAELLSEIAKRKMSVEPEQARQRQIFRRLDKLYYPDTLTEGGADHWPNDKAQLAGQTHVSVNIYAPYVDIPAALQSFLPVENYVPDSMDPQDREAAQRRELLYFRWKEEDDFELKMHKSNVAKGLYGFSYVKVFWNAVEGRPSTRIIERPENLYVGWGDSDYGEMDWAIYCYGLSKMAIERQYGLGVDFLETGDGKTYIPYVTTGDHSDPLGTVYQTTDERLARFRPPYERDQIEVYDYWYKKPGAEDAPPQIWNALYVGNQIISEAQHKEYDDLPYVIVPNSFIPGLPFGRSELWDIEQLIREKDERITNWATHLNAVVAGQMWQLTGQEAPDDVPPGAIPKPGKVSTPGAGNRLEAIQPWSPAIDVEAYLKRIDNELVSETGLNDLLLGKAPANILGSSRAIAALIANYETRIQMKRDILYRKRKLIWKMAAMIWERKDAQVKKIIDGKYRLDIQPPELTPRDQLEVANMAANLVNGKIWSLERAMDHLLVEDPEGEKKLIREEQTDATLNPAAVQVMVQLKAALEQLNQQAPAAVDQAAQAQQQALNSQRTLGGAPQGSPANNQPENQGTPPPEQGQPAPAGAEAAQQNPYGFLAQTRIIGGKAHGQIRSEQNFATPGSVPAQGAAPAPAPARKPAAKK